MAILKAELTRDLDEESPGAFYHLAYASIIMNITHQCNFSSFQDEKHSITH